MRRIILSLLLLFSAENSFHAEGAPTEMTCVEVTNSAMTAIFYYIRSRKLDQVNVKFYLSTVNYTDPAEIKSDNWSSVMNRDFDFYSKTVVILHGYKCVGLAEWILELKDELIKILKVNVIIIDWSDGSFHWNYVNSALTTVIVSKKIFEFFEEMRESFQTLHLASTQQFLWNHLYFIGHSLGAHIGGQASNLLQPVKFWTVERITGLDPAGICFKTSDLIYKVDKSDANFVDIIHTQAGLGQIDDLGLNEDIGHADFYVNGGVLQPDCNYSSWYDFGFSRKICSHRLAYKYFMDSLDQSKCHFVGHSWDGTYTSAENIIVSEFNENCNECPEMGINAVERNPAGKYLVIASTNQFCGIDAKLLTKVIKNLKKLSSHTYEADYGWLGALIISVM